MPVASVTRDSEELTVTVVAEITATRERLWQAYIDPP